MGAAVAVVFVGVINLGTVYRPTDLHQPISGDANPYSRRELTAQPVDLIEAPTQRRLASSMMSGASQLCGHDLLLWVISERHHA